MLLLIAYTILFYSFIVKDLMIADTELHPFVRFYKYFKKEESAFSSKYLLSSNVVLISHGERRRQSLLGHE